MSNYNSTLQSNNTDLQAILNTINELPEASGDPVLQNKTVTPTTSQQSITADSGYDGLDTVTVNAIQTETKTITPSTSQQNVTPSSGKYLSKVTVNAMPTATQATPSITINPSGLITATATQTAGYVTAGTKSATKQLAFQAAKTITPTTVNQTAVSSGYYTGGAVTVKGDSNLVAGNIKSGVSIFGVNGTYAGNGGSSGDTSVEDGLITRTITSISNERVTNIGDRAFQYCSRLTSANFPNVTTIGGSAFQYCASLTSISFPRTTSIGKLAFQYCSRLTSVSFPKATNIGSSAFRYCASLNTIYLTASKLCTLANSNAFSNTGIWSTRGSIFVPASLVASYKAATNWAFFKNCIFSYAF